MKPGDDASSHRVLEAQRASHRDRELPDLREGVGELSHRQVSLVDLDDGEVGSWINRDDRRVHSLAAREDDLDSFRVLDHVIVRDGEAFLRPDDTATARLPERRRSQHGHDRGLRLPNDARQIVEQRGDAACA